MFQLALRVHYYTHFILLFEQFDIGHCTYDILIGTGKEVWEGIAYKTAGCLLKDNLLINYDGKIV